MALNQQARNKFRVTSSIAKFISQSSKIHKWTEGFDGAQPTRLSWSSSCERPL